MAVGWSGDIFQAATRAEEANNGVDIAYVIPKEGAPMWFDMMAIPKDAKHPNNAHVFINFILRPEIAAEISNYVAYASANKAALASIDAELKANPGVYPTEEAKKGLFSLAVLPPEYAGRSLRGRMLALDDLDAEWRAEIEAFRQRPSGQFVLRVYREERLRQPA